MTRRRDWFYILHRQKPLPIGTLYDTEAAIRWAKDPGHRNGSWVVATDQGPGWILSTLFIGLDHSPVGSSIPLLFETTLCVEPDSQCEIVSRYPNWKEAAAGHVRALANLSPTP